MKTFAIMFFILSIINLPLYMMYQSSTTNNALSNLSAMWKYYTIGNIGNTDSSCDWSSINLINMDHEIRKMNFSCNAGQYISNVKYFGFLYQTDLRFNIQSYGESWCREVANPFDDALYLGPGLLGAPPEEDCTEDN